MSGVDDRDLDPPHARTMDPATALRMHEALSDRVRADAAPQRNGALPLAAVGVLSFAAATVDAAVGVRGYEVFWLVAAPATFAVLLWWFGRLEERAALRPGNPWWAIAAGIAMMALAVVLSGLLGDAAGPYLAVGVGYLALGRHWQRSSVQLAGAACVALAVAVALADPGGAVRWIAISAGLVLLAAAGAELRAARTAWR